MDWKGVKTFSGGKAIRKAVLGGLCIQLAEPPQSASKSLAMKRNLEVKISLKVACFV